MNYKNTPYGPLIYPENDTCVGEHITRDIYVEGEQIEFLKSLVKPGDVFMDIGAGIGLTTLEMSRSVGKEGYVLSMEAQASLFYTLCGNLALNNITHVQAFNRAACDRTGSMFYFSHLDFSQRGDLFNVKLAGLVNSKNSDGSLCDNPITGIALDDLGIKSPNVIKIDVNGMEAVVLNGLRATIQRAKPVLYVQFTENIKYLIDYLKDSEYDWVLHEPVKTEDTVWPFALCWHKDQKPEFNNERVVDLDQSDDPRHIKIRELINGTGEFTVA